MKSLGIIPARFGSTRFEGKPLVKIFGKSMIQRVYEQCLLAESLSDIWVATDDNHIFREVKNFGGNVLMTSKKHKNGTSRCLEAMEKIDTEFDFIVNIQGDEPLVHPEQINRLLEMFRIKHVHIATLAKKITDSAELNDPGIVKVIMDKEGKAITFLRTLSNLNNPPYFKHIGMYGYTQKILRQINHLKPTKREKENSLEQLRWMDYGFDIYVSETNYDTVSVDVPDDIEKVLKIIKKDKPDDT